jgi:hypothetical protein
MTEADHKTDGTQPGVMGDGTEEQNLGQPGDPAARITEDEVKAAFGKSGKPAEKPERK